MAQFESKLQEREISLEDFPAAISESVREFKKKVLGSGA